MHLGWAYVVFSTGSRSHDLFVLLFTCLSLHGQWTTSGTLMAITDYDGNIFIHKCFSIFFFPLRFYIFYKTL